MYETRTHIGVGASDGNERLKRFIFGALNYTLCGFTIFSPLILAKSFSLAVINVKP